MILLLFSFGASALLLRTADIFSEGGWSRVLMGVVLRYDVPTPIGLKGGLSRSTVCHWKNLCMFGANGGK
jgi:hypothetical protein